MAANGTFSNDPPMCQNRANVYLHKQYILLLLIRVHYLAHHAQFPSICGLFLKGGDGNRQVDDEGVDE
jgi:hypothetical protein